MPKITLIGAGSATFTRMLLGDILSFPELHDVEIALHDIDPERLETAAGVAHWTAGDCGARPAISAHADRRTALDGADYVINMVQVGGHAATLTDHEIPARYGLRQTIGDTLGIGGIFRALRTIPVMQGIAADMAAVANDGAWLLNYTNPMATLCWATFAGTPQKNTIGLCHSVQNTTRQLAGYVGVPFEEVTFRGAGVNHQAFILRFERDGENLYERLDALLAEQPELLRRVRMQIYRRFGYFPTESSEHGAEYLPWFMRSEEAVAHHRLIESEYVQMSEENLAEYEETKRRLAAGEPLPGEPSIEYAPEIIHSIETGRPRVVYGTVENDGLIDNLPRGAAVEVPCLVDRAGIQPTHVGALPPQCAALNRTFLNVCELTVRAAIEGDPLHVRHAAMLDPNAAATLSLDEIWSLCDELTAAHGELLPEPLRVQLGSGARVASVGEAR